jgi:transcriptional regulator with XRE-family HTH domain
VTSPPTTPAAKGLKKWIADNSSQTAVAKVLGVKQPTVSAWVSGHARPEPHLRDALAELTGIPTEQWELKVERDQRSKALARIAADKGAA